MLKRKINIDIQLKVYDIQGIISYQKIRIFEFVGFFDELNENKQINENIKKVIKTLKEVK